MRFKDMMVKALRQEVSSQLCPVFIQLVVFLPRCLPVILMRPSWALTVCNGVGYKTCLISALKNIQLREASRKIYNSKYNVQINRNKKITRCKTTESK